MRVLFAGTPQLAVPTLEGLAAQGLVTAVLTAPDAPSGRGRVLTPSPIKAKALELGLPVLTPERLGPEARDLAEPFGADLLVSFAFGRIFGPKFLALFPLGGVNLHPSLLPRHRGPAPAPAAILAGDLETGLTLQTLALDMDAGDILCQESWPITLSTTSADILEEASRRAPSMVLDAIDRWEAVFSAKKPQNHSETTYCQLLKKEDGLLDWNLSAAELHRRVRGFFPWPGAFTFYQGKRLLIRQTTLLEAGKGRPGTILGIDTNGGIRVQTGEGVLGILRLQAEGKRESTHRDFANGTPNLIGSVLGEV